MFRTLPLICLLLLSPVVAAAQSSLIIPGQSDDGFVAALGHWLEGDDTTALPALSELAQQDNRAAQVFLGQIEPLTYLHSNLTADMDRRDRIALLRSPGGLSGRSWLAEAQQDIAFASTLLDMRGTGSRLEATAVALELGQPRQALWGVLRLRNGDGPDYFSIFPDVVALSLHPLIVQEGRWLGLGVFRGMARQMRSPGELPWDADRYPALLQALNRTGTFPRDEELNWRFLISGSPGWDSRFGELPADHGGFLAQMPMLESFLNMCDVSCPGRARTCMMVASFVTPDPLYLYTYSPAEWAVSTEIYRAAARFGDDMRRLVETSPFVSQRRSYREPFELCELPF